MTVLVFPNGDTPLDLLLFAAVGREVVGLVEQTLAQNPGLADLGLWPPAGTQLTVTMPPSSAPPPPPVVRLY
jgi:phage tail protein X